MHSVSLLCLIVAISTRCSAMPPNWNPPSLPGGIGGSPLAAASRCVPIPSSLELCANIGYAEMRLPNMLNHDSVAEVSDHTKQWLPLTRTECHRDIRILLCSVYAPVCIHQLPDKQIKPCRSLCEAVRQPCAAFMQGFGFTWPDMLNCSQFPPDSDLMCIKSSISSTAECRACPEKVTYESIIGNFCINKVVLKSRLEVQESGGASSATRLRLRGRARHFKQDSETLPADSFGGGRQLLRSAVVDTAGCRCGALEGGAARKKYLVMGSASPDGSLSVSFLAEWDRDSRQFRRAIRQIRRNQRRRRRAGDLCRSGGARGDLGGDRLLPQAMPTAQPAAGRRGRGGRGRGSRGKDRKKNKDRQRGGRNKNRNGGQGRQHRPAARTGADGEDRPARRGREGGGGGGGGGRGQRDRRNRQRNRAQATLPPPQPQPAGGSRYSYDSFYYSDYKT